MNATEEPAPPQPRSPISLWLALAIIAAAAYVYVSVEKGPQDLPTGRRSPAVGRRLNYLQLEGLTGEAATVSLDDLQGRVSVINFWGTWCPPCTEEFPHIVALAKKFSDVEAFRLYPVSCGQDVDADLNELRRTTMEFLSSKGAALATYADQNAASRTAIMLLLNLDGFSYPTTIVLDRKGTIRGLWDGYNPGSLGKPGTAEQMESLVGELLKNSAT